MERQLLLEQGSAGDKREVTGRSTAGENYFLKETGWRKSMRSAQPIRQLEWQSLKKCTSNLKAEPTYAGRWAKGSWPDRDNVGVKEVTKRREQTRGKGQDHGQLQ